MTVDFLGKIDGVEFTGGKASDFAFVLGERQMLPDFEAKALGLAAGASEDVRAALSRPTITARTWPARPRSFELTVKQVEEPQLPELDAEFANRWASPTAIWQRCAPRSRPISSAR